jgi:hypothetical protein
LGVFSESNQFFIQFSRDARLFGSAHYFFPVVIRSTFKVSSFPRTLPRGAPDFLKQAVSVFVPARTQILSQPVTVLAPRNTQGKTHASAIIECRQTGHLGEFSPKIG